MHPEGCGGVRQRRWVGSGEARQGEGAGWKKPEVGELAPYGPTGGSVDRGRGSWAEDISGGPPDGGGPGALC